MRRRLPRGDGEVVIRERYDEVPPIQLNRELLDVGAREPAHQRRHGARQDGRA